MLIAYREAQPTLYQRVKFQRLAGTLTRIVLKHLPAAQQPYTHMFLFGSMEHNRYRCLQDEPQSAARTLATAGLCLPLGTVVTAGVCAASLHFQDPAAKDASVLRQAVLLQGQWGRGQPVAALPTPCRRRVHAANYPWHWPLSATSAAPAAGDQNTCVLHVLAVSRCERSVCLQSTSSAAAVQPCRPSSILQPGRC